MPLLPLLCLLCFLLPGEMVCLASDHVLATEPGTATEDPSDPVLALIDQLGSDDYNKRREAETALLQLGTEAFDYLEDAQDHPDLEIATQSQYLLHSVPIDWSRNDDSDEVRVLMTRYEEANGAERRRIISELSRMENSVGLAALSRIAHYELSPQISKHAALAVLAGHARHQQSAAIAADTITREVGKSPRNSAQWLRLYSKQLSNLDRFDQAWRDLLSSEAALLTEDPTSTSIHIVLGLMHFNIGFCQDLSNPQGLFEVLQLKIDFLENYLRTADGSNALILSRLFDKRKNEIAGVPYRRSNRFINDDLLLIHLVRRSGGTNHAGLALAMAWIWEQREWDVLPLLEAHYADVIKQDRLLLYLSAMARAAHGQPAAAEFADRAFNLVGFDLEDRNSLGDVLADYGYHNWAEREWGHVIDKAPITSTESMIARRSMANWRLHDRGEDKQAAELLDEVCQAFAADANQAKIADEINRPFLRALRTQRDYFMACYMESQKDYAAERKYLDAAIRRDPEDPDVLIAMYRLKNADEGYRKLVENRISRAVTAVEQRIASEPDEPTWYNHYAWLVSNTRGDFEKAIRYSHKSLELRPDTPSYLDTLGRCYYAAGDYENAVKYQRRAVELHPEVQVMRKQLELFETALEDSSQPHEQSDDK